MSGKRGEAVRARRALTQVDDSPELELRLFEILEGIRDREAQRAEEERREYHLHGLCAVLGYNPEKHGRYFRRSVGVDLFKGRDVYLDSLEAPQALEEAMQVDGAVLIDAEGRISHSGRHINVDEDNVYTRFPGAEGTYDRLKDTANAGTRHYAIIAVSALLPDLLFYALKSDHPQIRVFKEGQVLHSTVPEDENYKLKEVPYLKAA